MDLTQAVTLAGASILVGILVEALKRTLAWGQAQVDRFGALVAILVGILVVVLLNAAQGTISGPNPWQALAVAIITGILAGAAASGLYDGTQVVSGKASQPVQDGPGGPDAPGGDTTPTEG